MKLIDYISQNGQSASKLAEEIGVSVSTITRVAKGEAKPSHKLMHDIIDASNGDVGPHDFFNIQRAAPF